VYLRPKSKFVAQFIGETTFVEGLVKGRGADGAVSVETAAGTWTVAAAAAEVAGGGKAPETGRTVWLSLRPEVVQLHTERPMGSPNVFEGALAGTVYLGETAQHDVELPGGVTLKTLEVRPRRMVRDGQREPVRFFVDPSDVQLLTE
jgi:ABC-type Fe3+/spermidine/putrescine transport system ATPase subunit